MQEGRITIEIEMNQLYFDVQDVANLMRLGIILLICRYFIVNQFRIRTTTCALCELRGGALVKATLGSTNTYVHIICALAHRR